MCESLTPGVSPSVCSSLFVQMAIGWNLEEVQCVDWSVACRWMAKKS